MKRIYSEQEGYDLGYANPSDLPNKYIWGHLVVVNAFRCGQLDYQNQAPHNRKYNRQDYCSDTFEFIHYTEYLDEENALEGGGE